jgi:hypothetical protein
VADVRVQEAALVQDADIALSAEGAADSDARTDLPARLRGLAEAVMAAGGREDLLGGALPRDKRLQDLVIKGERTAATRSRWRAAFRLDVDACGQARVDVEEVADLVRAALGPAFPRAVSRSATSCEGGWVLGVLLPPTFDRAAARAFIEAVRRGLHLRGSLSVRKALVLAEERLEFESLTESPIHWQSNVSLLAG